MMEEVTKEQEDFVLGEGSEVTKMNLKEWKQKLVEQIESVPSDSDAVSVVASHGWNDESDTSINIVSGKGR